MGGLKRKPVVDVRANLPNVMDDLIEQIKISGQPVVDAIIGGAAVLSLLDICTLEEFKRDYRERIIAAMEWYEANGAELKQNTKYPTYLRVLQ